MLRRLKGFRTYILAVLVAIEPVLEAALVSGAVDFTQLARQVVIAAAIALIRTYTNTAPGRRE